MFQKRFKSPSRVVGLGGWIGGFLPVFFLVFFFFLDLRNPKSLKGVSFVIVILLGYLVHQARSDRALAGIYRQIFGPGRL